MKKTIFILFVMFFNVACSQRNETNIIIKEGTELTSDESLLNNDFIIEFNDTLVSYKKDIWISEYIGNFATFSKNGYCGVIDKEEKEIVPMEFDKVLITDSLIYANKHNLNFIFDLKGKLIEKPINDLVLRRNGKLLLQDTQSYVYYDNYKANDGVVVLYDKKIYNGKGSLIKEINYDRVYGFNHGFAVVINFIDNLNSKHLCGYIDTKGNEIYPIECKSCSPFYMDRAIIFTDNKFSIIDSKGNIKKTFPEDVLLGSKFSDGLCWIRKEGMGGYINTNGEIVLPLLYKRVENFSGGFAKVIKEENEIYIDAQGKEYTYPQYPYYEGYRFMNYGGKKVYENKKHEVVFQYQYDKEISSLYFEEGLLVVGKNEKEGVIDRLGNVIIPPIYQYIKIQNGYIFARENDDVWLLNKQGKKLLRIADGQEKRGSMIKGSTLGSIYFNPLGFLKTSINGKYGVVDSNGKLILPYEYDDVFFENNCITAKKGNNLEIYDYSGKNKLLLGEQKLISGHENGYITKDNSNLYVYNTAFKQKFKIKNIDAEYPQRGASYFHLLYPYKEKISGRLGFVDLINFEVEKPIYTKFFSLLKSNCLILSNENGNVFYNPIDKTKKNIDFEIFGEIDSKVIKVFKEIPLQDHSENLGTLPTKDRESKNRYYGLINNKAEIIQEIKYRQIDYIFYLKDKTNIPKKAILFGKTSNGNIVFFDENGNRVF